MYPRICLGRGRAVTVISGIACWLPGRGCQGGMRQERASVTADNGLIQRLFFRIAFHSIMI